MYNELPYEYAEEYTNGFLEFVAIFSLIFLLLFLVILVVLLVANYKIFKKAGKNGWECLIPIYATIVKFEFLNIPLWFLLIYLIPGVGIIPQVIMSINLAKKFDKDAFFALGLIILPVVFYPILAFSDAEYNSNAAGLFESGKVSDKRYCTNCGNVVTGKYCSNCGSKRV